MIAVFGQNPPLDGAFRPQTVILDDVRPAQPVLAPHEGALLGAQPHPWDLHSWYRTTAKE